MQILEREAFQLHCEYISWEVVPASELNTLHITKCVRSQCHISWVSVTERHCVILSCRTYELLHVTLKVLQHAGRQRSGIKYQFSRLSRLSNCPTSRPLAPNRILAPAFPIIYRIRRAQRLQPLKPGMVETASRRQTPDGESRHNGSCAASSRHKPAFDSRPHHHQLSRSKPDFGPCVVYYLRYNTSSTASTAQN